MDRKDASWRDDLDLLREEDEISRWIAAGAPDIDAEEWRVNRRFVLGSDPPDGKPRTPEKAEAENVPIHLLLAVTKRQAGELLGGKSEDWLERHLLPNVKTVKASRSVLIPMTEVNRWLTEQSGRALA